jgi:selenocysteine-specific elongation factor
MRRLILGTAGHIDHGKTALVRCLTGVDTDRLPEEKRRGITIDLGFARLPLPDGTELGIVDVPGHEGFVRNMLAGATGLDLMLLVVAADEGVMPQTREHLAIMELLGVERGVVALTKSDLADAEWLELVEDEVRDLLGPTGLATSAIVPVSARTGAGVDDLVSALEAAARSAAPRRADDTFRMPVDRVFTVRGTGTVVTGTVWSGDLRRDDVVRILPGGGPVRVRALQHHGSATDRIIAGERAAIALAGVDRESVQRGDTLATGEGWSPAGILTVEFRVLPDAGAPLRPRQRVRVHLGTAEVLARVALADGDVAPGNRRIGQLRLENPLVARAGDRFVLRSYSPVHTVAGGVVLEPAARKRKRYPPDTAAQLGRLADPRTALKAVIALAGEEGVPQADLPVRTGLPPTRVQAALAGMEDAVLVGDRATLASHLARYRDAILHTLDRFHAHNPLQNGMDRESLRRDVATGPRTDLFDSALEILMAERRVEGRGGEVARTGFQARPGPGEEAALRELGGAFRNAGLEPPDLGDLPTDLATRPDLPVLLRFLERSGTLVRLTPTRWADAGTVAEIARAIRTQLPSDRGLAISDFKQIMNLTRKHLIPLLEYFDRTGVTARRGDERWVAGPTAQRGDATRETGPTVP